jgi:hypothetical protein
MCEFCSEITLRDNFYSPQDYLNCLDYISELLSKKRFFIVSQTCDIKSVKKENGCWEYDIIEHKIKCQNCGNIFKAHANTYCGGGGFRKCN